VRRYFFVLFLLAFVACTKTPDLLENTELPDSAFVWSTVSISSKGVKQTSSQNVGVVPQDFNVILPIVRLRYGMSAANKYKVALSVFSSGVTATGLAEIALLDGDNKEVIPIDREKGTYHRYAGSINSLGQNLKLPTFSYGNRPCLEVTFSIKTGSGAEFKRLSTEPICPGVVPVDLSIKFKSPVQTVYRAADQIITLRLERPMTLDNPMRRERLVVTVPNVENLTTSYRINATCITQENTLTCEGSLGQSGNNPKTMDVQIYFDTLTTDPINITATYTSLALETVLANNTTTATLPVLEPPNTDLALTWNAPSQIIAGLTFPVTVNITNLGTATSTARKFTARLGNVRVSNAANNCGVAQSNYLCVIPPIPPNGTHSLTWNITTDYPQRLYLEAVVFGNNLDWDVYNNNQANLQIEVIHDPATITDVTVALTATPNPPQINLGQQYSITVTNISSNPATSVEVQFYSEAGIQFVTSDCTLYYTQCSLGTLAPLESRVITLTSASLPNQATERISAYVSTSSPESDLYNNNQKLYVSFPGPDFALALVSNPNPITQAIGQQHSFTVQNLGTLPEGFHIRIYLSADAQFNLDNNQCYELHPQEIYCSFPNLAPNQSQTVSLTSISVETKNAGSVYAEVGSDSTDADTSNNQVFQDWQFEP
jgi:hypothetical protein